MGRAGCLFTGLPFCGGVYSGADPYPGGGGGGYLGVGVLFGEGVFIWGGGLTDDRQGLPGVFGVQRVDLPLQL